MSRRPSILLLAAGSLLGCGRPPQARTSTAPATRPVASPLIAAGRTPVAAATATRTTRPATTLSAPPTPAPAATQPGTVPAAPTTVPIVHVYPAVRPLPQAMADDLLAAAAASDPARQGRRPWFITVHQNRGGGTERHHYRAMLYFSPDAATGRVRTGRFLLLWWWTGSRPQLRDYVQVSRPDHPFRDDLAVPAAADLPFELEHPQDPHLGEPDWAGFVDFARPLLEADYRPDDRPPPYLIARSRTRSDLYGVATGTDESGDAVTARRTPNGFVPADRWAWSGSPWGGL